MALAEKRICEHTDATTISSIDEFIVDSMANGTRNITMTNLENQILSTDTYSALTGIGDGTITGSIADIDSNLNNLTYDSTTNRLTMTGNTAFSGTIDSVPTAGSGNAVSSGGTKTYVDSAVSQLNDEIDAIDNLLLPISGIVKRFSIQSPNRTIDTGINVNLEGTTGFIALVSSYGSYNAGRMNIYIGGVPHNKQDGTCGEFKVERLGGIALGGESGVSDNITFTVTNDTLRMSSPSNQGGLRITLILTTSA